MQLHDEKLESGYQIVNVVMVESLFTRISKINFGDKDILSNLDVDVIHNITDDVITTDVTAHFSLVSKNETLATSKTRMVGVFKTVGSPQLSKEKFATINAPAIIYPFIREHVSSLSLKGALGQVLIPPLNFTRKKVTGQEEKK
jgi:preprotein translocase subunit SecB